MSERHEDTSGESQDALRHEQDREHHPFEAEHGQHGEHDHGPEGHSREECEHPEHEHHHDR